MEKRDVLLTEVSAALAILGLLLVYLPLFIQWFQKGTGGQVSQSELRERARRRWLVVGIMVVAALDATLGLLALWGAEDLAVPTGYALLALVWLTVALGGLSVYWGR